ncbi:hypothetical protein XI05_11815 [Bradyrhizobium sp. CCBAU 11357]|nr:hypothetical protein [Bradyrhizobium sp. CCBAU 11357]
MRLVRLFDKGGSVSSALELSGLQLMLQAAVCDVSRLMRFRSGRIASGPAAVDIGWREVVDALMIADVIIASTKAPT